jgi:predicted nucleotide-binding protein
MTTKEIIENLIKIGEELEPKGGDEYTTGYNGNYQPDYVSWRLQTFSILEDLGKPAAPLLKELQEDKNGSYFYQSSARIILGVLKAALVITERKPAYADSKTLNETAIDETQVFIVHGHNDAILQTVARFVEKLHLKPIILFEQPGQGKSIIEKFEKYSSTKYAVVLFTPDDLGRASKESNLQPRARQNVVLELGYFIGKLGRQNVAVLFDESVEMPSDYRGVEYIALDPAGAWKFKLAREMKAAGLPIDMNDAI